MPNRAKAGFTLIELMVVIVILGALAAVVVPNLWHALADSNTKLARIQMKEIGDAVDIYRLSRRQLPESLEALTEPDPKTHEALMRKIPIDPWQSDYEYRRFMTERAYQIRSFGRDRQSDTDDDLVHPDEER